MQPKNTAVLLISCPDRKGLVAAVAGLLYRFDANITHADQHQDRDAGLFFMRVEWVLDGFDLAAFQSEFEAMAAELHMTWQLKRMADVPRVALFVSQHLHCYVDVLQRHRAGELNCTIPLIISNHLADAPQIAVVSGHGARIRLEAPCAASPDRSCAGTPSGRNPHASCRPSRNCRRP
mgnify:CR=1 FL=1